MTYSVSGIDLRISQGKKAPEDLRLDRWDGYRWVPVQMELAFFLVDFFTENERHLQPYRSWWVKNGDTYFLDKCVAAVKHGWRVVADEVRRQREARA